MPATNVIPLRTKIHASILREEQKLSYRRLEDIVNIPKSTLHKNMPSFKLETAEYLSALASDCKVGVEYSKTGGIFDTIHSRKSLMNIGEVDTRVHQHLRKLINYTKTPVRVFYNNGSDFILDGKDNKILWAKLDRLECGVDREPDPVDECEFDLGYKNNPLEWATLESEYTMRRGEQRNASHTHFRSIDNYGATRMSVLVTVPLGANRWETVEAGEVRTFFTKSIKVRCGY